MCVCRFSSFFLVTSHNQPQIATTQKKIPLHPIHQLQMVATSNSTPFHSCTHAAHFSSDESTVSKTWIIQKIFADSSNQSNDNDDNSNKKDIKNCLTFEFNNFFVFLLPFRYRSWLPSISLTKPSLISLLLFFLSPSRGWNHEMWMPLTNEIYVSQLLHAKCKLSSAPGSLKCWKISSSPFAYTNYLAIHTIQAQQHSACVRLCWWLKTSRMSQNEISCLKIVHHPETDRVQPFVMCIREQHNILKVEKFWCLM